MVAFRRDAGYVGRVSYSTKVTLVSPAKKAVDLSSMRPTVEASLDAMSVAHDVIPELEALFVNGKGAIKLYPAHIRAVMVAISKQHPETRFVIKTKGEDEKETAHHAFEAGVHSEAKAVEVKDKKHSPEARAALTALEANPAAEPYSANTRYAAGAVVQHPSFGKGIVLQSTHNKIVVQFTDAERTLVHARPG
jgi:hypothetical protein